MTSLFLQAGLLIFRSVAEFFSTLLLIRFFMQLFRVPFSNPVGTLAVQLTNWLVLPLRRVLPGVFGLDLSSLLPAYLIEVLVIAVIFSISGGVGFPSFAASWVALVLIQGALSLLRTSLYLLIGLLIVQAILSWINPYSPAIRLVNQVTDVFLRPIRRFIPPIANIDLSPLIAILLAQVLLIFL